MPVAQARPGLYVGLVVHGEALLPLRLDVELVYVMAVLLAEDIVLPRILHHALLMGLQVIQISIVLWLLLTVIVLVLF
jgi:hypothetical protein